MAVAPVYPRPPAEPPAPLATRHPSRLPWRAPDSPGRDPHVRPALLAPPAVRLHDRLPLPVPAAHDGARAAHRRDEGARRCAPGDARWDDAARFWIRIFGINFAVGVVTGIPMEFQFGTNWARFSRYAGRRDRPDARRWRACSRSSSSRASSGCSSSASSGSGRAGTSSPRSRCSSAAGSPATSSSRPTPSCSTRSATPSAADGTLQLADFWAFLFNPWALAQYAHNMIAAVVTGVVRRGGGRRVLRAAAASTRARARASSGVGVVAGLVVERAGRVPDRRPAGQAGRAAPAGGARRDGGPLRERPDGRHHAHRPAQRRGAPARQPDRRCPGMLSFLAYGTFHSNVHGPRTRSPRTSGPTTSSCSTTRSTSWPGSARCSSLLMALAALLRAARRARRGRAVLWVLMLAFPFPYIATTAGWMTAELGRQPWLVYGLMRTARGRQPDACTRARALFTLIGFTGLYFVLGVLFLFLVGREIAHGPRRSIREPAARTARRPWLSSGSPSSPRCSPPTSCSTASTSAPARCTCSWRGPTPSAGRCWPRSARSGTATRCGCSPGRRAVRRVPARARRPGSRASTSRSSSCSGRSSCAASRSSSAATSTTRSGARSGTRASRVASTLAAGPLRRRARQPRARRAARRGRLVRARRSSPTSPRGRRSGSSTGTRVLVGVFALVALAGARRHVPRLEDRRPGARAQPPRGGLAVRRGRGALAAR